MKRHVLNLATGLSALLSLVATVMWVRSGYVTDSWELAPRPAPNFFAAAKMGWVTHRHIESTGGRVVWVNYDALEAKLTPWVFYQVRDEPLAIGPDGPGNLQYRKNYLPPGTEHGRIPYVAEWYLLPRGSRHIAGSWLVLILAGGVLPLGRWLWSRRRARAKAGPAFPVLGK